jgi:hypothetical protein
MKKIIMFWCCCNGVLLSTEVVALGAADNLNLMPFWDIFQNSKTIELDNPELERLNVNNLDLNNDNAVDYIWDFL